MVKFDCKETISKNIIFYRKALNLTQAELAEQLNYSDKAISKWERAETIPDVIVLNQMATIFGITLDKLCSENSVEEKQMLSTLSKTQSSCFKKHLLISLMSAGLVLLTATVLYVLGSMIWQDFKHFWLVFIYAIPCTSIVLIVLNFGRRKRLLFVFTSILVWTTALSLFLSIPLDNSFLFFLIAAPMQVLTLLWFLYKKIKKQ